jgi:hypothetical protein
MVLPSPVATTAGMNACWRQGLAALAGVLLIMIGFDQVRPRFSDWLNRMPSTGIVNEGLASARLLNSTKRGSPPGTRDVKYAFHAAIVLSGPVEGSAR